MYVTQLHPQPFYLLIIVFINNVYTLYWQDYYQPQSIFCRLFIYRWRNSDNVLMYWTCRESRDLSWPKAKVEHLNQCLKQSCDIVTVMSGIELQYHTSITRLLNFLLSLSVISSHVISDRLLRNTRNLYTFLIIIKQSVLYRW